MSARFDDRTAGLLALVACALLTAACSTGGSTRPETGEARVDTGSSQDEPRRPRRGEGEEMQASADAVLAEVPERARAAHERAVAALAAEDWIEAELELEQLVLEFPDFPGPYVNLAIVYAADGREAEAVETLERALEAEPLHAAANNELAILLREQGRFEAAEAAYRRALEADPGYALAHYNLGVLLDLYLGRGVEALEHYERYQELAAEPDPAVGRWIIDLRRRYGVEEERVAQEDGA